MSISAEVEQNAKATQAMATSTKLTLRVRYAITNKHTFQRGVNLNRKTPITIGCRQFVGSLLLIIYIFYATIPER